MLFLNLNIALRNILLKISEIKILKDRWMSPFETSSLCESEFGLTHDGNADYRGSEFSMGLFKANIENGDFSYAKFNRGILESTIKNCIFLNTKTEGLGTYIDNCLFEQAKLNGEGLSGIFTDCTFSNSVLKKVYSLGGKEFQFIRCKFINTKLHSCEFNFANFSECIFNGCEVKNTAFSDATFVSSEFTGCNFIGYLGLSDAIFKNCGISRATFSQAKDLVDDDTIWG
jgi:uncharacterized protein YjbI with pentapeptide repeats